MTPTPRTDAAETMWNDIGMMVVLSTFARQLERELDFGEKTGKQIWGANERLQADKVKLERELTTERALADRLAVCLDDLQYEHNPMQAKAAFEAWKEARNV